MNQITLNLIAIGIFSIVLMVLGGPLIHLSPTVPALIVTVILIGATMDTLGFQGQGGDLFIDAIAQQNPEYRRRILHHEAGHFLVAYLLDIPVTDYTLSAWAALQKGQKGRGGVQFDVSQIVAQAETGTLSAQAINTYCTIWMAGIAAEQWMYGEAEGGGSDRQQIQLLWSRLNVSNSQCETKIRWSILNAKTLIEQHQPTYLALVEKMKEQATVEDCIKAIQLCQLAASSA
ncbi:MAG: ATP-dependent Zn protease [Merismopedia sp. SIO2A8]|nr:ATP-dependent Zn protease [Symploca sp. SIO2B6]NET54339.1 ATP-dependent Zn protease [Merismopedia sp. SIO2A8]